MKIGIDARLWNETGVGRYVRNLVLNLQKIDNKNEYVLFILSKDREGILKQVFDREAQTESVQNDTFKIIEANIRWHTLDEQLKLPQVLSKENLDLVHFPYFSVPVFYKKPFIVTIHDLILHHFPTGEASTLVLPIYQLKLTGYKFIICKAAQNAEKIITVSNATKKEIVEHLGVNQDKVVVTPEGTSLISKLPPSPRLRRASKIQSYFLYVGNAYPHKNLERLLEAFKNVKDDIRLVLVGKEDYFYKRLKEKVKEMGLSGSVIFYGEASDEKLAALYQNAKALVLPSLMEGFGLPALEAMTNKCLVLASDIPALKEICQDAAVYFDPYNVNDLAEKIRAIHSNDTYHYSKNIEKGLRRAGMFSWEKMAKETLKVYESCLSLRSSQ